MPSSESSKKIGLPVEDNELEGKESVKLEIDQTPELKPAPFLTLFRYTTRIETALDLIGLVAAALVGSAQVECVCLWLDRQGSQYSHSLCFP